MAVPIRSILAALALALLPGAVANATCDTCQRQPPAQVCQHNCAPPPAQNCQRCSTPTVVVPTPFVPAPNVVVVNAGAQAQANATSIAIANVRQGDIIVRGGGGGYVGAAAAVGVAGAALSVTEAAAVMEMSERTATIQAICLDSNGTPHPASQTFGERDVNGAYVGEIFRCMAGTRMRVTHDGRSFDCVAGEALWHENGAVTCKTQIARRPCNERSLLRRFGPGEKVVRLRETREARRETTFSASMTMDGGVGQGVY